MRRASRLHSSCLLQKNGGPLEVGIKRETQAGPVLVGTWGPFVTRCEPRGLQPACGCDQFRHAADASSRSSLVITFFALVGTHGCSLSYRVGREHLRP